MAAILINGVNYSAATINNIAFGVPVIGITAINYDIKQTKENNYGLGVEPISRGYGQKMYEGSITVYREWWQSVIDAAPGKDPQAIPAFDWTIAFGSANTPIKIETLKAFEFTSDSLKVSAGDTKLLIDIPFIFAGIVRK